MYCRFILCWQISDTGYSYKLFSNISFWDLNLDEIEKNQFLL